MSVEKTNSKISIDAGNKKLSDYERKLRSQPISKNVYKKDIENYVMKKVEDPILRNRVLGEIAKYPCQAINFLSTNIDNIIRNTDKKLREEKNIKQKAIKLPAMEEQEIDISEFYESISHPNSESLNQESENISENHDVASTEENPF